MTLKDWMTAHNCTVRGLAADLGIGHGHAARLRNRAQNPSLLLALKVSAYTRGEVKLHEMIPEHLLPPDSFRTRPEPTASKSPETA